MKHENPKKVKEEKKKRRRKEPPAGEEKRRVSADELLEDIGNEPDSTEEAVSARTKQPVEKEKGNGRRTIVLTTVLILILALLVAIVLEWGWISDKITGLWEEQERAEARESPLFLINPSTGQEFQEETVNTAIALADDKGVIHGIVEIGWNHDGGVTAYWVSEGLVGKSQDGKDLSLSDSLGGNLERSGEFRYILERLTGQPVHYVVIMPMRKALLLFEGLDFPPVTLASEAEYNNVYTQTKEKMSAGRTIKDMDRVASYLLDEGGADEYFERVRRSQPYLEEALRNLAGMSQEQLSAVLEAASGAFIISPSGQGEEGRDEYMSSLLSAWADGMEQGCQVVTVPEINILNGCGVVGAGSNLKNLLEGRGFMVAESGANAKVVVDGQEYNDFSHQTSVLYYGTSDPLRKAFAEYLALIFAIPKVEYQESIDGVTIIVGNDLAGKKQ